MAIKLIKVDKNGTKYYTDDICPKCGGRGRIGYYSHVDGGICFQCEGSGTYITKWKEYTPEYEAILNERRLNKAREKTPEHNRKFLLNNNFNEEGNTWIALGDTYKIKEKLKESGAKFDYIFGWHFNYCPTEYETLLINIDEITFKNNLGRYFFKEDVKEIISSKLPKEEESPGEFIGTIGDRINTSCKFIRSTGYESRSYSGYGTDYTYVYIFEDCNGDTLVWRTSSYKSLEEGVYYKLSGIIKDHKIYKNKKQTILKNCKIDESES